MGDKSGIEWTDATWNPTTGCDRVSPGCDNCYALSMAKRLKAMGSSAYQQDGDPRTSGPGFAIQWHDDRLDQPLRWTKPRKVFVNSMSDLFHPRVPDEFIARVFAVMAMTPRHTYQVLTKRPKRMRALLGGPCDSGLASLIEVAHTEREAMALYEAEWPLPNVWLGTSVEDQQRADERIPALIDTPAAVRFLSCEPLLGPVDLSPWVDPPCDYDPDGQHFIGCGHDQPDDLNWVIVGGESGPDARPMHPHWARDLRDQAVAAGVPFLFKQWGAWAPAARDRATHLMRPDGYLATRSSTTTDYPYGPGSGVDQDLVDRGHPGWARVAKVGKHAAGRVLDGRTWDEFPQEVAA